MSEETLSGIKGDSNEETYFEAYYGLGLRAARQAEAFMNNPRSFHPQPNPPRRKNLTAVQAQSVTTSSHSNLVENPGQEEAPQDFLQAFENDVSRRSNNNDSNLKPDQNGYINNVSINASTLQGLARSVREARTREHDTAERLRLANDEIDFYKKACMICGFVGLGLGSICTSVLYMSSSNT